MTKQDADLRAPEWEPVWKFFLAHMNQDYEEMYGDVWEAVHHFASQTGPERIELVARGLRRLLAMFDDDEALAAALDQLGMAYDPPSDGYTYRHWLAEVATFLESWQ